jgi:hypothetical protein
MGQVMCVDPSGRLLVRTDSASPSIFDADIAAGKYYVFIWFEYGFPAGSSMFWRAMPLQPLSKGVAYIDLPADLPAGLCPFSKGTSHHPIRLSMPHLGADPSVDTYENMGTDVTKFQADLVTFGLPDQTPPPPDPTAFAAAVGKYPDPAAWSPVAVPAKAAMDEQPQPQPIVCSY